MLHRFDLHTHSFFSADACNSPEELIAAAQARGLSGIAITDHDSTEAHEYMRSRPLTPDFLLVPGVEVGTAEGHLLCIGATLPRMKGRPASEVCGEIHRAGGLAIPAHPFDVWRAGIRPPVLDSLPIDALEVFNAASSRRCNARALDYARSRGLPMTAASDAHHDSAVGVSATAFEMDELSVPALLAAIRKGGTSEGNYLTFREAVKKNFANWFRIFNSRPRPVFSSPAA
jgi:predicted metal-dependent phosphoesterase TrpH